MIDDNNDDVTISIHSNNLIFILAAKIMSLATEKFLASNTLSFVVTLAVGKVTTVELRNESHVTGRITEVNETPE